MWDVHAFVGERVKALGLDFVDLSRAAGKNHAYAQQFVARKTPRVLPEEVRAIWAPMLGVSETQLRSGYVPEPIVISIDEAERVNANGDNGAPAFYAGRYAPRLPGGIPEIDGATGAGEGVDGEIVAFAVGPETYSAHRVVEEWVIPPSALDGQLGLTRNRTIVMRVTGDSMEPTYPAGQRVFVDTHHTTLTVDAVYIISDGESAPKIKRLQRVPASSPAMVRIISDNPLFPTDTVPLDKIRIHGRVAGALVPR